MPRVPILAPVAVSAPRHRTPAQAAAPFHALEHFGAQVTNLAAEERVIIQRQERATGLANANAALLEGLAELQQQASQNPDSLAAANQFREGSANLANNIGGSITDPTVAAAFQADAIRSVGRSRISVSNFLNDREASRRIAALDDQALSFANKIDLAATPEESKALHAAYIAKLRASTDLTAVAIQKREDAFDNSVDLQAANRELLENPGELGRTVESREKYPHLTPEDRVALTRGAITEQNRRRIEARQRRIEANLEGSNEYIERFFTPTTEDNPNPTIPEIATDPRLTPETKRLFIGIAEQKARGVLLNRDIPAVGQELYRRVTDPDHPLHISEKQDLIPWVSHGLSTPWLKYLGSEVDANALPGKRNLIALRKEFMAREARQITTSNLVTGFFDPLGESGLFDFTVDFSFEWSRREAAGEDPYPMINPKSPDFWGGAKRDSYIPDQMSRISAGATFEGRRIEAEFPNAPATIDARRKREEEAVEQAQAEALNTPEGAAAAGAAARAEIRKGGLGPASLRGPQLEDVEIPDIEKLGVINVKETKQWRPGETPEQWLERNGIK